MTTNPSSSSGFHTGGTTIGGANSKRPSDVLSLDYCTFRVPYEEMNVRYRIGQKQLEKAAHITSKAASLLSKKIHGSNEPISQDTLRKNFDLLIKQVQEAKQAFANSMNSTMEYSEKIMFRCDEMEKEFIQDVEDEGLMEPRSDTTRHGRYIAWHLLRCGMIETAKELIKEIGMEGMIDMDVFEKIYDIQQALHSRNTKPCIEWCDFNKSKLRRLGSRMEIVARQQDVITFVEDGNFIDAVKYVKTHLVPIAKANFPGDLTKLMGAIACPLEESRLRNPDYHAADRFEQCALHFLKDAYRLYGLAGSSALETLVQMGLASQKTPVCRADDSVPMDKQRCVVCRPEIFPLSEGLPYAHVDNSRILCTMYGTVCDDDDNIPYLFPSGHVFGLKAVEALRNEEGNIFDPINKDTIDESEILRLYFL